MRAALNKVASAFVVAASKLDGRDAMMFIGLVMLGGGIAAFNVPAGAAVPGAILVAVSIFGTR